MAIQEVVCALFHFERTCNTLPMDKFLIEYMLVPSVITIIIVYIAANAMLKGMGLRIHAIVAITMYIVLIYSGFYAIFAPLMYNFMLFFVLIIGVMVFFTSRIIPPSKMATFGKVASKIAEKRADISIIRRSLELKTQQIKELDRMIEDMRKQKGGLGDREYNSLKMMIHQATTERDILASQIHELDKYKNMCTSENFALTAKSADGTINNIDSLVRELIENLRINPKIMEDITARRHLDDFDRKYYNMLSKMDKDRAKLN